MLEKRLQIVEDRIAAALARAGRKREEITLVAVTKVFPAEVIREAWSLGLRHFGENYVQEFAAKHPLVAALEGARFHFIGHLQSNKSARAAELFDVIETVDTPKLARRLNDSGKPLEILLEVHLSGEASKSGVPPQDLPQLVESVRACPHLHLRGLMTMPPYDDNPELSRPYFRRLRELAQSFALPDLSMGMSHDFEVAIEEGATIIRVGTALFGSRRKP